MQSERGNNGNKGIHSDVKRGAAPATPEFKSGLGESLRAPSSLQMKEMEFLSTADEGGTIGRFFGLLSLGEPRLIIAFNIEEAAGEQRRLRLGGKR